MKIRFAAISMLAILITAFILPASATTYAEETLLIDHADLLTEAEEQRLVNDIMGFIEKTDCHLTILTDTVRYDYYNTPAVLDVISAKDLVVLTVSYTGGQYYYYLYTYGKADSRLSNGDVNAILDADAVYDNLKGGNIYDGLVAFIDKTENRVGVFSLKFEYLPTIILVSLVAAAICCGIVAARYKMKLKPTNYPLDRFATLELTERQDIFTGSFVTKRHINTSSGGSGGRAGGGRSGGGRSGGGRGGR